MRREINLFLVSMSILAILILLGLQPGAPAQGQVSWLPSEQIVVAATGTPGAVSASEDSTQAINGHIYAIHLDFASSISTTTDITITQISPAATILQRSNYYTDSWYYPSVEYTDSAGSGRSAYTALPVMDNVRVAVGETSSSSTGIVTATVLWGE
jgi:hypothetical protein